MSPCTIHAGPARAAAPLLHAPPLPSLLLQLVLPLVLLLPLFPLGLTLHAVLLLLLLLLPLILLLRVVLPVGGRHLLALGRQRQAGLGDQVGQCRVVDLASQLCHTLLGDCGADGWRDGGGTGGRLWHVGMWVGLVVTDGKTPPG